jgi:hypothetical protein
MSVASRFENFLSNLSLSQTQRDDAKTKYDGVCGKLHNYFYDSAYNGSTRLLVGSYGKRTNIRPPRDVDVFFIMPFEKFEQYNSYNGNGQSQLLQDIKNILKDKYTTTDKIRGDGQVVVVPFQNGHSVELLPAWLLKSGKYFIPHTHGSGSWKETDPKAEMKNVDDSDKKTNGNTRNLIKMIKAWQGYCKVPIKSLVVELRAVNFLNKWKYFDKGTMFYDWMIRDFFKELLDYVNVSCQIPGIDEKIQYGDAWESKAESALIRAKKAFSYEADEDEYNATLEWKKIFGDDFEF